MNTQNQMQAQNKGIKVIKTDSGEIKLSPQIIRQYLVSGGGSATVTDQEIMMFLGLCEGQKLNPFIKEAYLIKYGNAPATMVVSKDVFMKRAIKNADFDGIEAGVIVLNGMGEVEYKKGALYIKGQEQLIGAWATVHRKSWKLPLSVEVNFDEYVGRKGNGEINGQWGTKPATMILKVAKTHALREAFVEDMQGMYSEEEMNVQVEGVTNINSNPNPIVDVEYTEKKAEVEKVKNEYQESLNINITDGNDMF